VNESLLLRPATIDDLPLLLRTDTLAGASFNWSGHRDGNRLRERLEGNGLIDKDAGKLVVEAAGEAVGSVGWVARHWSTPPWSLAWEIGITLVPEARGRGHGSQAQRLLCDYLFATTNVNRLQATTNADNVAEQRSLLSAGFSLEGVVRGAEWLLGCYTDVHLFSRLRSEWVPPTDLRSHL
jgi:ribosomal-protein-alanine N-acetyltransferase